MGKGVVLKGKNKEKVYPVSASDLIFDPTTKKSVKADLAEKVEEAPSDGKQYGRVNGTWKEVEAGEVNETAFINLTPNDGKLNGVSVKVTTNDGQTLLDTTWQGSQLSVQVRGGLTYTVSVGDKEGYIKPDSVSYVAVKGSTRTINMAYIESKLTVEILSNQGVDSAISGVKATVKYGSTTVQVSNGGTIMLPANVNVIITFPSVNGYKTPETITYTHSSGAYVKSGTYKTELVKVTLSTDNGQSVSGQKVTINGTTFTYGNTSIEHKVPFDTNYSISVDGKSGYTLPASQSFNANQSSRNVSIVYKAIQLGVFIQGVSGKLYTSAQWANQETPNGIAVLTEECQFVMGLRTMDKTYSISGVGDTDLINGIVASTDINIAKLDLNGYNNTELMIEATNNNTAYAAYNCKEYTFPNGQKGYLGSAGEWNIILNNFTEIEGLLTACGIELFDDFQYYSLTSTQYDKLKIWYADIYERIFLNESKVIDYDVIPLTTFN